MSGSSAVASSVPAPGLEVDEQPRPPFVVVPGPAESVPRDVSARVGGTLALVGVLLDPLIVAVTTKLDWPVVFTGYAGVYLLGASFMAVGILASSLTANMVIAAMITFAISLLIWLAPSAGQMFGGAANDVLTYLSVINHQENLGRGVIDTTALIFYVSFIGACLFMAIRSVETYHWR